jgi:hypothetical protein
LTLGSGADVKVRITMMVDGDVLDFFRKLAEETGGAYQR